MEGYSGYKSCELHVPDKVKQNDTRDRDTAHNIYGGAAVAFFTLVVNCSSPTPSYQ